jgi:hypothetical protein
MAPVHIPILGFLLGFFVVAWVGAAIVRPRGGDGRTPGDLVLGATVAIAVYALFMSLMGMAGAVRIGVALTLPAILLVLLWHTFFGLRWKVGGVWKLDWSGWRPPDLQTRIIFWLLVIYQAGMFINALAPHVNPDAEISHYLFIKRYLQTGIVTVFPENAFSYYPQALEMAVLNAFSRAADRGPEAANLCFWFMQLLLMGWVVDFCARRGKPRVGWHLAAAVSGLFYWPVIAYSGYVDGGVALFSLAGVFTYFDRLERRNRHAGFTELALPGFLLGTACASKYSALPIAALVFLHVLWIVAADNVHRRTTFISFLGFLLFFVIPIAPWYLRNLLATGNPVFPFMRGLFGGPELTLADDVNTWAGWGLPVSALGYILYPFKLAWFSPLGNSIISVPRMYMTWLFGLAPIAGILLFHRRLERIAAIWCFIFFSFVYFTMNLQNRYFITFTALALWLVVEWLESFVPRTPVGKSQAARWIVFVIVMIPFATQLDLVRNHFIQRSPYILGSLSRDEYIAHVWPSADVFRAANELATEDDKVLILSLRTYNLTAPYEIPSGETFRPDLTPERMLGGLADSNIRYLLMESRVRRAATLIDWCLANGGRDEGELVFDENGLLSAVGQLDVQRGLARELLRHRGGRRYRDIDGVWRWSIDLDKFRRPELTGILGFLANVKQLESERLLLPVKIYGEWELYEIVGRPWRRFDQTRVPGTG